MMRPWLLLFIIEITIILSSCHESTNPVDQVQQIESVSPEVEGPYQFKTTEHQLFYANSSAKKFQLIDISELNCPYLANQMPLSGYPQAFYHRGSQYLLVQHHPWLLEGNRLTVLSQEPAGNWTTQQDFT